MINTVPKGSFLIFGRSIFISNGTSGDFSSLVHCSRLLISNRTVFVQKSSSERLDSKTPLPRSSLQAASMALALSFMLTMVSYRCRFRTGKDAHPQYSFLSWTNLNSMGLVLCVRNVERISLAISGIVPSSVYSRAGNSAISSTVYM